MTTKRVEHLVREFGQHGGVVFTVSHEALAARAHAALDVGHGADGRPVVTEFVHSDVVAEALPNVVGGHSLADDIGVIRGDVEKAASADGGVVYQSDVTNRRANARAENAKLCVALLFKPTKASASIENGLAGSLQPYADVRAAKLVGARVAARHAAVVVGAGHSLR